MLRKLRNYFLSAFRELFVYHHSSLEFRAKIYALFIASATDSPRHYDRVLQIIAAEIYSDADRASTLLLTLNEYLSAIEVKKTLSDEKLLSEILRELRLVPRYALKIEPEHLARLQECTQDHDSKIYQGRLLDFLAEKRREYETAKG